jgi:hypothetical protein
VSGFPTFSPTAYRKSWDPWLEENIRGVSRFLCLLLLTYSCTHSELRNNLPRPSDDDIFFSTMPCLLSPSLPTVLDMSAHLETPANLNSSDLLGRIIADCVGLLTRLTVADDEMKHLGMLHFAMSRSSCRRSFSLTTPGPREAFKLEHVFGLHKSYCCSQRC